MNVGATSNTLCLILLYYLQLLKRLDFRKTQPRLFPDPII